MSFLGGDKGHFFPAARRAFCEKFQFIFCAQFLSIPRPRAVMAYVTEPSRLLRKEIEDGGPLN